MGPQSKIWLILLSKNKVIEDRKTYDSIEEYKLRYHEKWTVIIIMSIVYVIIPGLA